MMCALMSTPSETAVQNPPAYFTKAALCDRWKVSAMTLWRWAREGKLHPLRFGRGVRFSIADVEKFEREAQA